MDPFSEEFQADPVPIIDRVRARSWLARTPISALVLGREQVHKLLSDPRLRSALPHLMRLQGVNEGELYDLVASALHRLGRVRPASRAHRRCHEQRVRDDDRRRGGDQR